MVVGGRGFAEIELEHGLTRRARRRRAAIGPPPAAAGQVLRARRIVGAGEQLRVKKQLVAIGPRLRDPAFQDRSHWHAPDLDAERRRQTQAEVAQARDQFLIGERHHRQRHRGQRWRAAPHPPGEFVERLGAQRNQVRVGGIASFGGDEADVESVARGGRDCGGQLQRRGLDRRGRGDEHPAVLAR